MLAFFITKSLKTDAKLAVFFRARRSLSPPAPIAAIYTPPSVQPATVTDRRYRQYYGGPSGTDLVIFRAVFGYGFQPAAHMHLLADVFDVGAHGLGADAEFIADLLVDKTGGEQFQNLAFARR